jgi:hypothetical protein
MYLGLAIYETLDEDGELKSDIMSPPEPDEVLVVDDRRDVNRSVSAAIDVGPLRIYADRNGISFRFVASRMGGQAFQKRGDSLSVSLAHSEVPLPPSRCGYYGLLLPRGFIGDTALSIKVDGDEQADHYSKIF